LTSEKSGEQDGAVALHPASFFGAEASANISRIPPAMFWCSSGSPRQKAKKKNKKNTISGFLHIGPIYAPEYGGDSRWA